VRPDRFDEHGLESPEIDLAALVRAFPFPDPREARPDGLLAYGGDLHPARLLAAYAQGIFPWYDESPILWFSPDPRTALRLEDLRINRTLRKNLARRHYDVRMDTAFREVIETCATTPRAGQNGTWISDEMIEAYVALHALGFAHSIEAWQDGALVGGLYGLSLGRAFFGESMFARASDASKVAFAHLAHQLALWGFDFLDCQAPTPTTESLGATEWPRDEFLAALEVALQAPTRRGPWAGAGQEPPQERAQERAKAGPGK
jgi:leucyl/phenylalanyl-tRNA--protein transferase